MDGSSRDEWIPRLFSRLRAIYGNKVALMWGDADPEEVRATWETELRGYEAEDMRAALNGMRELYQDYPPTLFQFAGLCRDNRRMRAQRDNPRLHAPAPGKPDPEVMAQVKRLAAAMDGKTKRDHKDWARRILKRHEFGERLPALSLQYAREALGMDQCES